MPTSVQVAGWQPVETDSSMNPSSTANIGGSSSGIASNGVLINNGSINRFGNNGSVNTGIIVSICNNGITTNSRISTGDLSAGNGNTLRAVNNN
jgi:hypothetical protein